MESRRDLRLPESEALIDFNGFLVGSNKCPFPVVILFQGGGFKHVLCSPLLLQKDPN